MKAKKAVLIVTAIAVIALMATLIASAAVLEINADDPDSYLGEDLTQKVTEITSSTNGALAKFAVDKSVNTYWQGERRGSYVQFYFADGIEFNTVVLNETGMSVSAFAIEISNDGTHFTSVYTQDRMQRSRLCALERTKAKYVRITINESEASPRINNISIYNTKSEDTQGFSLVANADFREYMIKTALLKKENPQPGIEDVDRIFDSQKYAFYDRVTIDGAIGFDRDGRLKVYADSVEDDTKLFEETLNLFKSVTGENVRIALKIKPTYDLSSSAASSGNALDKLADEINSYVEKYGFAGVDIDCTDYDSKSACKEYCRIITSLAQRFADSDKKVFLTATQGQLKYLSDVADTVDGLNLKAFGKVDQNGDGAAFYASCVQAVEMCVKYDFDLGKINLGAPLYGFQSEGMQETYGFDETVGDYYFSDNVYECLRDGEIVSDVRFNGPQLLYDKTCYAIYKGLGGMTLYDINDDRTGKGEDTLSYFVAKALADVGGGV